jgi:Protein of unknown function (DUF2795)
MSQRTSGITPAMEGGGWLDAVEFPATKVELIDAAASGDATQETIERLQRLGREQYESPSDVEAELDRSD